MPQDSRSRRAHALDSTTPEPAPSRGKERIHALPTQRIGPRAVPARSGWRAE
jgi:hypothetical protein